MSIKFELAIREYLKAYESNFNYQNMFQAHMDPSRFYIWVSQAAEFHPTKNATVLCSGCGSAGDLYAFMDADAVTGYGIEVEFYLAKLANLRFAGSDFQSKTCISLYDGGELPYKTGAFDIIFSIHVIEHTKIYEKYLQELFRVLKPGGIIFMDLPNRYYYLEQHTLLRYIHYLPNGFRDYIIKYLITRGRVSKEMKYRLSTFLGYHFPSPTDIINVFEKQKRNSHLKLLTAFFHSYDKKNIPFKRQPLMYFIGERRKMTTFRVVIAKLED
jgi:SAM-dependent methyltransferase